MLFQQRNDFGIRVRTAECHKYLTINGNTCDFIDHPLPKDSVSAHGASHHAWAPGPHNLNPALHIDVVSYKQKFLQKF